MTPRVTVLVTSYKTAAFVPQCLASLVAQTFQQWRAVFADDASGDGSVALAQAVADPRISVLERPRNLGAWHNVNLLLQEASAEYVAILNADDWWEPEYLEVLVGLLDESPTAILATADARDTRDDGRQAGRGFAACGARPGFMPGAEALQLLLTGRTNVVPSMVLAHRRLFEQYPGFDLSQTHAADWLMWIRAATMGDFQVSARPLCNYRVHDASLTAQGVRDGAWMADKRRLFRTLEEEWAEAEPYPGARHHAQVSGWVHMVGEAFEFSRGGRRVEAVAAARYARDLSPSPVARALSLGLEGAVRTTGVAWMTPALPALRRGARRLADGLRRGSASGS